MVHSSTSTSSLLRFLTSTCSSFYSFSTSIIFLLLELFHLLFFNLLFFLLLLLLLLSPVLDFNLLLFLLHLHILPSTLPLSTLFLPHPPSFYSSSTSPSNTNASTCQPCTDTRQE
ncbi:hypothetical protein E2C01_053696 [Portunus trituberculatus]|uniref:Uncharacterized protein n=1 Tax=Portunus trituberculatus TaxID=210409 RepID=A0A5B7GL19_PORTR|nr:hypothetical protein [Portunus trituberculatus]